MPLRLSGLEQAFQRCLGDEDAAANARRRDLASLGRFIGEGPADPKVPHAPDAPISRADPIGFLARRPTELATEAGDVAGLVAELLRPVPRQTRPTMEGSIRLLTCGSSLPSLFHHFAIRPRPVRSEGKLTET